MNRDDIPWFKYNPERIYLDNAATAHKPYQVITAVRTFYEHDYAPVYRSMYGMAEEVTMRYEQVRERARMFINARSSSEIVFVRGATEGINFVAATWAFEHIQEGDEIVLTQMEHHSNILPWQWLAHEKKAVLKYIPVTGDGQLDFSLLDTFITERTKLVAAVSTSNVFSTPNNLQPLILRARAVGARILVDACQSVPHEPTDVQALDCDFLVFSGHKMMGPTGIGILYIRQELHDETPPYQRGGGMVRDVHFMHAFYKDAPHKFEVGTPASAEVIGLGAAFEYYMQHINFQEIEQHETSLTQQVIDALQDISTITILGPVKQLYERGHSVTFVHKHHHPHDLAAYLDMHNISVRAGHCCAQPLFNVLGISGGAVRLSFFWYTTPEEVKRCIEVIQKYS